MQAYPLIPYPGHADTDISSIGCKLTFSKAEAACASLPSLKKKKKKRERNEASVAVAQPYAFCCHGYFLRSHVRRLTFSNVKISVTDKPKVGTADDDVTSRFPL